jgi:hypothetical protein
MRRETWALAALGIGIGIGAAIMFGGISGRWDLARLVVGTSWVTLAAAWCAVAR